MADASQSPAGWYPDPRKAGQERYWNGTAWTVAIRDVDVPITQASVDADRARMTTNLEKAARAAEADLGILRGRGTGTGDTISIEEAAAERASLGSAATRAAREATAEIEGTTGVGRLRNARDAVGALADRNRITRAKDLAEVAATEDVLAARGTDRQPARVAGDAKPAEMTPRERRRLLRAEQQRAEAERAEQNTRATQVTGDTQAAKPTRTSRRELRRALKAQQQAAEQASAPTRDSSPRKSAAEERRELRKQIDAQQALAAQASAPETASSAPAGTAGPSAKDQLKALKAQEKAAALAEKRALAAARRNARNQEKAAAAAERQRAKEIRKATDARLNGPTDNTPAPQKAPRRPQASTRTLLDNAAASEASSAREARRAAKAAERAQRRNLKADLAARTKSERPARADRAPLFGRKKTSTSAPSTGNSIPVNPRGINNRRLKNSKSAVVPIGMDEVQAAAEEQARAARQPAKSANDTEREPKASLAARLRGAFSRTAKPDTAETRIADAPKRRNTGLTGRQNVIAGPAKPSKTGKTLSEIAAEAEAQGDGYVSTDGEDPAASKRKRLILMVTAGILVVAGTVTGVVMMNNSAANGPGTTNSATEDPDGSSGNGPDGSSSNGTDEPSPEVLNPAPTGNLNVPEPVEVSGKTTSGQTLAQTLADAANQNITRGVPPITMKWVAQDGSLRISVALDVDESQGQDAVNAAVLDATARTLNALRGQEIQGMELVTIYTTVQTSSETLPNGKTKAYDGPISRIDFPVSVLKAGPHSPSDLKSIATRYVVDQGIL